MKPNVFTIPASAPFLPALIDALLAGRLVQGFPASDDPLELSRATLYLPTRRACRLARDVFLDRLGTEAAILPRIVPLGDIDEDEIAFAEAATGALAEAALALPPAIAPLERRLLLAELILQWANTPEVRGAAGSPLIANTPPAALGLADDLARLMDDMTTRQVAWSELDGLVPDDLDHYWQLSLRFLKIAREAWPALRAERGAIEATERRDQLIEAEARRLAGSDAPVIAAGSTGSMPATAKLLATIAKLPHGAVVLPGLDLDLDAASWDQISGRDDDKTHDGTPAAGHAQFAMQALLKTIGITRDEIETLSPPAPFGREALVSEALRPAATTERWQAHRDMPDFAAATDRALAAVTAIESANAEEEALSIAVTLREALDTPGKTAALVTPDRALARRVRAALDRWHVAVDDSGGDSLADTSAGVFARLAGDVALNGCEPVTLLALLKHPLLRLGATDGGLRNAVAALERALLRGPRPRPGSDGLRQAIMHFRANRDEMHRSDPRWLITPEEIDAAAGLIEGLGEALAPLEQLKGADHRLAALTSCHKNVVAALSRNSDEVAAFDNNDGEALSRAYVEIIESPTANGLAISRGDYLELFHTAIADRVVRRPEIRDVRVHIYGPLEARLQNFDLVVLGGLNETTWPPETRSDPWLSRPMRRKLGLDAPERRIGLSAHDFAQMMGAREVVLSRAAKVAGAPTVSSRFVQRIAALAGAARWQEVTRRGERILAFARALDQPAEVKAIERPAPKPPIEARPSRLSVTAIEDWLRDPYTVYAKHILRLQPLDPVDTPPGARDRGTVIHGAIGDFTVKFADSLPLEPLGELLKLGEARFAALSDFPEARAFWWPRFKRIAQWFVQWERNRRATVQTLHAEIKGEFKFPIGQREFTLSAIADRIEWRRDGSYAIVDYKTGQARTEKQVRTGLAPQLTLEGAILRKGGFKPLRPGSVAEVAYVTLRGGYQPGKDETIDFKDGTPDTQADHALTRLIELANTFEDAGVPYLSLVHPMWSNHYGDYDHLARVKEWSLGGRDEELP
ncbi:double-strand break repair protein AddB [Pseudolabrys sp. Root1462]|uniref:double-strand break repair protein AddB n=1 Tax=Pseudolabrys sp. Root1462 TaxID=1736466 RepID=UPI0007023E25|nr:double-strand break repair protein AddB [Pseudolabrys sp. Root1462]KQY97911.1 double-strand break repair protein AddB [Pseudolabrys sp. Root1462]